MKKYIIIPIYIISLFAQSCFQSEKKDIPNGDCLTLLIDRTDTLKATKGLLVNEFTPLLKVTSSDPLASAKVCLAPVTNIRFEGTYSVTIPETDQFSSNELERQSQIDTFKTRISLFLTTINSTPCGRNGSAIFENMALELNDLASCKTCPDKRMVVISDLLQNTKWFNAYHPYELGAFINNPKLFNKKLDKYCPIEHSIKGIIINLVHQPKNVLEDNQFYQISNLLKEYYEGKGAIVKISTTLNK